jgi:hypothetical protein
VSLPPGAVPVVALSGVDRPLLRLPAGITRFPVVRAARIELPAVRAEDDPFLED